MQSRSLRDGSLGLLILVGIFLFGGAIFWLKGLRIGDPQFSFVIKFPDTSGLDVGSPVKFRGVAVGKVQKIVAASANVEVTVVIENPKLAIPLQSSVETTQSGLLGGTSIDIFPQANIGSDSGFDPIAQNCNAQVIVCQGKTIEGERGVNFTQTLRETTLALRKVNEQGLIEKLSSTLQTVEATARSFKKLSETATRAISTFEGQASKFGDTATAIARAADQVTITASSADDLIQVNREKLAQTLDGIAAASREARSLIASAKPLLADGKFVESLQKLSENAAETASNLRKLTGEMNNPATIATLRETLDSARATFANAQKITADLDELTGDPKFRNNIRNLVNGLSGLLSTAPSLTVPPTAANPAPDLKLPVEVAKSKSPVNPSDKHKQEKIKVNSLKPNTVIGKPSDVPPDPKNE
ncbi:ABC-type transport system involved in resistance to organic solvents, periplasmic component [Tumidithrix helvetica PCC 7403]|uniref:MlaD family protein n=1 Tax=Tumidithrix helvetica TaxID=3457545 RepID=UPI003C8C18D8